MGTAATFFVSVKLDIINKKECVITIGNARFLYEWSQGAVKINLYHPEIYTVVDDSARLIKMLNVLSLEKNCNYNMLMRYMANTKHVRIRQIEEICDIPRYIAQQIVIMCIRMGGLISDGYSYKKSAVFAAALANYEIRLDGEKSTFTPVKELTTDTAVPDEEAWEKWAEMPDGLEFMAIERTRIENSLVLRDSKRKRLLKIADDWIAKKKDLDGATKPKKSEKQRVKEVIEEEKREAAKFDAEEKKKMHDTSIKNKNDNDRIDEYDPDDTVNPITDGKHFRKKKLKKK